MKWHKRVKPNTTWTLCILAYIEEVLQSDRESPVGEEYRQQLELIATSQIPEDFKEIKELLELRQQKRNAVYRIPLDTMKRKNKPEPDQSSNYLHYTYKLYRDNHPFTYDKLGNYIP